MSVDTPPSDWKSWIEDARNDLRTEYLNRASRLTSDYNREESRATEYSGRVLQAAGKSMVPVLFCVDGPVHDARTRMERVLMTVQSFGAITLPWMELLVDTSVLRR